MVFRAFLFLRLDLFDLGFPLVLCGPYFLAELVVWFVLWSQKKEKKKEGVLRLDSWVVLVVGIVT